MSTTLNNIGMYIAFGVFTATAIAAAYVVLGFTWYMTVDTIRDIRRHRN